MEGRRLTGGSTRSGRRLELVKAGSPPLRVRGAENAPGGLLLVPAVQVGVGVLAAGLATAAFVIGLSVDPLRPFGVVRAVAEALAIALSVAAGLYALRRTQSVRFARLLVVAGLGFAPVMLAMLDESVPYSIGRAWAWTVLAGIIYLLLAFPVGHLTTRGDRWLAGSAFVVVLFLYLPTVLFAEFPLPSPWTGCSSACPANAFKLSGDEPGFVSVLVSMRDVLSIAVYAAAGLAVGLRRARSSPLSRRVHGPVLAVASLYFFVSAAFLAVRKASADADVTEVVGLTALALTPAFVLAFISGLIRWRIAAIGTWRQLASDGEAGRIREVLADALRDPGLEVGFWGGSQRQWIDEDGRPFALPPRGSVRAATEVTSKGRRIAILVHEDSVTAETALREVVQGVTLMALGHQRLEAEARASLRELSESRSRILAAIDRDRLRIERDLHDGAQQRLIALKINADRGAQSAGSDTGEAAALFKRIGSEATAALDEVRALARGVYPALLVDHGLTEALRDAASRSSVSAEVRTRDVRRYPQEIEAAVYFCCLEALQNAEKHASASSITIDLIDGGELRFEVRDDGIGFDPAAEQDGAGVGNMSDRVAAVGGRLRIDSVIGAGTRVAGRVPMLPDHVPAEIERLVLRAADALEDAMGIYRAVRTSSGNVVDFAVEHVNDVACQLGGLSREAQVGKTLGQLRPGYVRSPSFEWHCMALESDDPIVREEVEYAGSAGSRRLQAAHEVRAVALGAGRLALVWRDITARKRAEHWLELRAEALGRERDGVFIVRAASATIVYANPQLEEMFGYSKGELEGRPASKLDWTDASGESYAQWRAADRFEAACRRKDGSRIWCEVTIDGFDDVDLGWCWVAVHHDVTERRESLETLAQQRDQLRRALRNLPALGYITDRDLRATVLFDNLVEPTRGELPLTGTDTDLFGASLAKHVTKLNSRVLVSERPADTEVEVDIGGPMTVLIGAEPDRAADGTVLGIVGSIVERTSHRVRTELGREAPRAGRARALRRR